MAEPPRYDEDTWRRRVTLAFFAFVLIAAFFLLAEHRAHILPWLPWLFLAACPLMHLFMHHGHGRRDHRDSPDESEQRRGVDTSRGPATPAGPSHSAPANRSQHRHGSRSS